MEVEYTTTIDDLVAFNVYYHDNSPVLRRQRISKIVVFLVLVWSVGAWLIALCVLLIGGGWLVFVVCQLILVLLTLLGSPGYSQGLRQSTIDTVKQLFREGKNRGMLGKHRLSITGDRIAETSEVGEERFSWAGVEKIIVMDTHLFIHKSAVTAYVIPKAAFRDEREFQNFVETAQRYHQAAIGSGDSPTA